MLTPLKMKMSTEVGEFFNEEEDECEGSEGRFSGVRAYLMNAIASV